MRELYHAARMRLLDFLVDLALPPRETDALVRSLGTEDVAALLEPVVSGADGTVSLFRYAEPAIQACILETNLSGNARRMNVAGAFAASRACDPYRTYIVVDDVITTGNTMLAACQALRAGGAQRLLPLTLAY